MDDLINYFIWELYNTEKVPTEIPANSGVHRHDSVCEYTSGDTSGHDAVS